MTQQNPAATIVKRYRRMVSITVVAVFLLILAGGIVRSTGSGLGCPDWPRCFGEWIPPTSIEQLPADYKARFHIAGREIADFDAFKTWVEYLNRLLGALIGVFALLTIAFALPLRKTRPVLLGLSVTGLLLVLVAAWVGAKVVSTHLHEGTITLHMLIALATFAVYIAAMLLAWKSRIQRKRISVDGVGWALGLLALGMVLLQIVLGTQVREEVDQAAILLGEAARGNWLNSLGEVYDYHRMNANLLGVVLVLWLLRLRTALMRHAIARNLAFGIAALLFAEFAIGVGMHHFGLPPALQPLHLLLGTGLFALVFALLGTLKIAHRSQAPKPVEQADLI